MWVKFSRNQSWDPACEADGRAEAKCRVPFSVYLKCLYFGRDLVAWISPFFKETTPNHSPPHDLSYTGAPSFDTRHEHPTQPLRPAPPLQKTKGPPWSHLWPTHQQQCPRPRGLASAMGPPALHPPPLRPLPAAPQTPSPLQPLDFWAKKSLRNRDAVWEPQPCGICGPPAPEWGSPEGPSQEAKPSREQGRATRLK